MTDILSAIAAKKLRLDSMHPLPNALINNLSDWFTVELTYTSNAIEGNTLSRAQTAQVVEKGITVEGKTLQEHQEAINHAKAFSWVETRAKETKKPISEDDILAIHRIILTGIDDTNAGRYRNVAVRIAGSRVILPNPVKVPTLMSEFITWLHDAKGNILTIAADVHFRLVSIHPFTDGNGRTARLLMNLLLMQSGYPPAIIRKEDRHEYIDSIENGQLKHSFVPYYRFIYKAIDRSLDIYLDSFEKQKETEKVLAKPLLKIGELASLTKETVPTIRYWTREGLLEIADHSPGGYQLYEPTMVTLVQSIRKLQKEKRLTLSEIKKKILE